MTGLTLALSLVIAAPLMFGLISYVTQLYVVRDRKGRTGAGWDARDTFEIKDAVFGVATFCVPIGATMGFLDAKLDLPSWQWWTIMIAVIVAGSLPMQWHGHWSAKTRKSFETTPTDEHP